jgi:hypothetical protein
MGGNILFSAPINEAVYLPCPRSNRIGRAEIASSFVRIGIEAGDCRWAFNCGGIERLLEGKAFDVASKLASDAGAKLQRRIKSANRTKLAIQILTVISSASVLGTIITDQKALSKIVSLITILISIAGLLVDRSEKLLNPNSGNIYEAYEKLMKALVELRAVKSELELAVKHLRPIEEIQNLIASANAILESINILLPQIG